MTRVLLALGVLAATLPVAGQAPRAALATEWRQFRGTANLTGVSASVPPATLAATIQPSVMCDPDSMGRRFYVSQTSAAIRALVPSRR